MEEDPKILSPLLTPLLSRAASTAATPNPSGHGGSRALEAAAAALKQATAQAADAAGAAEAGALDTAAPLGAGDTSTPLPPQRVPAGAQPEAEPAALQQPWRPLPPRALRSIKLLGMMRVVYTAGRGSIGHACAHCLCQPKDWLSQLHWKAPAPHLASKARRGGSSP